MVHACLVIYILYIFYYYLSDRSFAQRGELCPNSVVLMYPVLLYSDKKTSKSWDMFFPFCSKKQAYVQYSILKREPLWPSAV